MQSELIVKNQSQNPIAYLGVTINAGDSYTVPFFDLFDWCLSPDFQAAVLASSDIVVSDGNTDFKTTSAIDYMKSLRPTFVVTRFERDDRTLKATSASVAVDSQTGQATVEFDVPGSDDRTISGGEAWFGSAHIDDWIMALEVYTKNDIPPGVLGPDPIPAGTIVQTYHDTEMPAEQQGYRIPFKRGLKEVETIAGYGTIPAGLTLRIKVQKGGDAPFNDKFYCNVEWGIKQ